MTIASSPPAKAPDEVYCQTCGNPVKKQAVICVHCGVPLRGQAMPGVGPKGKTSAVLLAVFLGFWTWLYTYERDAWKFWLNIALIILSLGIWGIVAWPWAIVDTAVKPSSFYENYPYG